MTTKSEGMMTPSKLKWYVILALALWLAFSGVAAAEQLYVNESGWWRDGGAFNASGTPIQAAVGAAGEGDAIYVEGANYYENVDVDKPRLTLVGEGADVVTVTAADSGDHVFEVTADWVNISGFAVRGATDEGMIGIYLDNANYCTISENGVYGNYRGICLDSSSNNTLTSNTANSNYRDGIYLGRSSNNTLSSNTANSNNHNDGISLIYSSNNLLTNNTANSNDECGICLWPSSNNTLTNNNASNNEYGIRLLFSSEYNTLTNNNASNNEYGIRMGYIGHPSNYNILTSNTALNNDYGIYLDNADNNDIVCNWVQNNKRGFYLSSGSTDNNISCNNIIENGNYNTTSGGWEWQIHIAQYQPVETKHNYWGAGMNNETIDASIYDDEEGGWGEVEFYLFETDPVPCAPIPELPTVMLFAVGLIVLAGYARRR